ncbi:MAG: isocitrate dehydrogenase (NAD(+)) [Candidatus Binatia bacterium]
MSASKPHRVTLIPGDGVGPEVIGAATRVVEATGVPIAWDPQVAGLAAVQKFGDPIPEPLIRSIRRNRVALKGPLETQVGKGFRSVNVALRKRFDLYANLRPVKNLSGVKAAFSGVDLIVIRENTEDVYAGIEHQIAPGVVEAVKVITARASRRIARFAFEHAIKCGRRRITAIHKANIMKLADGLFLSCARQVAKRYPSIRYDEMIVDNACMQLVLRPGEFDVLLLENLYGDIVSDLCAGLVGGLGVVPGANLGNKVAIFEAVHGTAPDIAGKNVANPIAATLSAAMMLDHLGEQAAARRVRTALEAVIREGQCLTRDLGGNASTTDMAEAICRALQQLNSNSAAISPVRLSS